MHIQRPRNVVGRRVHADFTTLPPPRQFFPGGRKRLFYCILDDKICAKVWGVDCIQLCTGVSYLSLHLHAVCPFMARCAMGLRGTCHAVVKVYYIRGMVYYGYTRYGGSCNMDCMQCALCVISSRSASELNCDGMRAARNTSFHRSPTLPTFVCFSRNGAGIFKAYMDLLRVLREDYILRTSTDMTWKQKGDRMDSNLFEKADVCSCSRFRL